MRDQRDVEAAKFALGGLDDGRVRGEVSDVECRRRRACGAADAEIGRYRLQAFGVACDEEQRVAALRVLSGDRFGDRRRGPDDEDLLHRVSYAVTRRQKPEEKRGSMCASISCQRGK